MKSKCLLLILPLLAFTSLLFPRVIEVRVVPVGVEPMIGEILATTTAQNHLPTLLNRENVRAFVVSEAKLYGINPDLAVCIVSHESQWQNRPGDDGNSRGIFQISKIWHPEVSDAVAYSITSSTLWALNWIRQGNVGQWSTFLEYCSNIKVLE